MVEIDEKQIFSIIQKAKEGGSIRIGANEATKAVERGQAKLVVTATDVSPAEIVAHFEGLCKEMKIVYASVGTKAELGSASGVKSTAALVVIDAGPAKKDLEALSKELLAEKKEAPKEEEKVVAPVEEKVEEAVAEESPAEEESTEESSEEKKE
jgi:large subunit ribosomal protein L7Ae